MRARVRYWLAPGLRSVELIAADYEAQRFSPHWHSGFAVGVVTRHRQRFRAEGRDWVVGPGDVILLNPGQVHDGSSLHGQGWSSRMAYLPEAVFAEVSCGGGGGDPPALRFNTPVLHAPALAALITAWHGATEAGQAMPRTADVLQALLPLMRPGPDAASGSYELGQRLCLLSAQGPRALSEGLARLEAPRTTAWRQMRALWGLSPQPLLTHLRLVAAKRLLAAGRPVVDAALETGYHDQSHFTRRFAAAYGMTPAQFRRAQMDAGESGGGESPAG